ncbi:MAG: hypothetical protein KDA60_01400 [Planctomycetales bacterium]|nr:hypothetical protein [Planctomycetales bacterium]
MDKLRDFMRAFKRVHFWVVCGLITLVGVAFWYMASSSLKKQREQAAGQINQKYTEITSLTSQSPHPNASTEERMAAVTEDLALKIQAAWKEKEAQQENIYTWPQISDSFLAKVQSLHPIEKTTSFPLTPQQDVLTANDRERYRKHVDGQLQSLAAEINAKWTIRSDQGMAPVPEPTEASMEADPIVNWTEGSQKEILEHHFRWPRNKGVGQLSSDEVPQTLDVLYAQEDLWILTALMNIIKATNEGATTQHNARIRAIRSIKIGQEAVPDDTVLAEATSTQPVTSGDDDGDDDDDGGVVNDGSVSNEGDGGSTNVANQTALDDPADGRYVDDRFQPLPSAKLREVMQADRLTPEDAYLAVAKRVPIRMKLTMDQRHIQRLLIECANSRPTVEVRQFEMETLGGAQKPQMTGGGGRPGFGRPSSRAPSPDTAKKETTSLAFPYDVTVEVYGIVYFYNPVPSNEEAKKLFGIDAGSTDGGSSDEESAPPESDDPLAYMIREENNS